MASSMGRRIRLILAGTVATVMLVATAPSAEAAWTVPLQAGSSGQARSEAGPSAPATVTATCVATLSGQITVSWSTVSHASSYTVYSATAAASGPYSFAATIIASPWTTPTLGLSTYWFEVTASVGTNWTSAKSAASNAHLIVATLACV